MHVRLDAVFVTSTFGLDYEGIDPKISQKTIRIGDVISSVNGVSVLSSSFMDILDILTSNREAPRRVLQFKNVSVASVSRSVTVELQNMNEEEKSLTSYRLDDVPPHDVNEINADNNLKMTPVKSVHATNNNRQNAPSSSPAAWKTYPATPDIFATSSATTTPSVRQTSLPDEAFSLTISPKAVRALSRARALVSLTARSGLQLYSRRISVPLI